MKKIITITLTILMSLSLAACGSFENNSNSAAVQEEKIQYIEDTEYLNPDEVTSTKSQGMEISKGTESDSYKYLAELTYEDVSRAVIAYDEYRHYIESEFPKGRDNNGNIIILSDPAGNESSTLKVWIMEGIAVSDELIQEMKGKYLLTELGELTDFLKESWENKTYYQYIEIADDETLTFYSFDGESLEKVSTLDLYDCFSSPEFKYENGKITMDTDDGQTIVFERCDEIPD